MLSATCLLPSVLKAQWSANSAVNNAICTATDGQSNPAITSDGSGGAIVTWTDLRNGTDYNIYAQRISVAGNIQWTANGVLICSAANDQGNPAITSDGSGGAVITWPDSRGGILTWDIYAQRIDASGAVQWTANGVAVCTATNNQLAPKITGDGGSGAIVTWYDLRSGTFDDVYAQRINSAGTVQWTANGVVISSAANDQNDPVIAADGSGGAIITWMDLRNGVTNHDIYSQRINAAGTVQWTANGVAVCLAANNQDYPMIASDGSGGALVTWYDNRNFNIDIYTQKINSGGTVQWTANGVAACIAADEQTQPTITTDGSGGAIITWMDLRNAANYDIYTQRIDAAGTAQWTANGIAICSAADNQMYPVIVSDGSGGAVIAWQDFRNSTNYYIFAQRINAAGAIQWAANGITVSSATNDKFYPQIISSGCGSVITWYDFRNGADYDIYAQQIDAGGVLGGTCPLPVSLLRFTGYNERDNNVLEWTTTSEMNSDYFIIERGKGQGTGEWEEIGKVKGAGNASATRNYSFLDREPSAGINYYRLKQTDYDGKFTYSNVVHITMKQFNSVTISPNPAKESLQITISGFLNFKTEINVRIYDVLGREVYNYQFLDPKSLLNLDVNALSKGMYFLKIANDGEQAQIKFVKE